MIKFRKIDLICGLSTASLVAFFVFSLSVNAFYDWHEQRVEKVLENQNYAQSRLDGATRELSRLYKQRDSLQVVVKAQKNEEVLWLARALYSETRRPYEMRYVGWVIRNRVEAGFNGEETYRDVILDHKEFSAFNEGYPLRDLYVSLDPSDAQHRPVWHDAMAMAVEVMEKPDEYRPFPKDTFYYYSQVSMPGYGHPEWRHRFDRVAMASVDPRVEPRRFRFFRDPTPINTSASSSVATAR